MGGAGARLRKWRAGGETLVYSSTTPRAGDAPPRVSVIVPTRNGAHLLPECLAALWAQTYLDYETLVVDDASTDGTHELLLGYPEIRVVTIEGREGHGFVAAANIGIREAHGEIMVLLNNDAVPDPRWLEELLGALDRNPWASMAASRLMLYNQPDHFHSAGDYYATDGVPNSRGVWQPDSGQYEKEEEVFGPCAAAAAYRREVLLDLAGAGGTHPPGQVFDPLLWMYLEDVDLSLRARLKGHRTVYAPGARVRHRLSATGGGPLASYYVGRNTIYVLAKCMPGKAIRRWLPRILAAQARIAWEALLHVQEPAARARLKGQIAGALTWPRVLPTRKRVMAGAQVKPGAFARAISRFSRAARRSG
jgi:GT2 family glycosyltransferase